MRKTSDLRILVNGASYLYSAGGVCETVSVFSESAPQLGGMIRVSSFRNVFSADAVCAAAMIYVDRKRLHQNSAVLVECDGLAEPVPVVVNPIRKQATCVLPVPQISEAGPDAVMVRFPGTAVLVCRHTPCTPLTESDEMVVVDGQQESAEITIWRRAADGARTSVAADGLAAAAAAIVHAKAFADGVTEHDIQMQGGTAEVGVSMQKGRLSGLSVCSTIRILRDED